MGGSVALKIYSKNEIKKTKNRCFDTNQLADFDKFAVKPLTEKERVSLWEQEVLRI